MSVGSSCARTSTVPNSVNPTWDQTFYLFVRDLKQRLIIRVLDEDILDSDDLLGAGARGLADLADEEAVEVEVPLAGGAGTVTLRLRFDPFRDPEALREAAGSRMGAPVCGCPAGAIANSPWRQLQALLLPAEVAADAAFDPVAFIENKDSDTQVWVYWNRPARKCVVAFRGTEQTKWKDVLTDVSLVPTSLDPEGVNSGNNDTQTSSLAKGLDALRAGLEEQSSGLRAMLKAGIKAATQARNEEEWCHAGFLKAYRSVRAEVLDVLGTMLAGEQRGWTIYVTGHSLGGALSTLCAYDCAKKRWQSPRPVVVNYSFGSPRVGNRAFAQSFNALVPDCWRVVNSNDAVPLVPRLMGYAHVGGKVQLMPDGRVEMERDSGSGVGEGTAIVDFAAAVVTTALTSGEESGDGALAQGFEPEKKEEVAAVLAAEMDAMNALLDGSGVADHLEPLYLANLRTAIDQYFMAKRGKA